MEKLADSLNTIFNKLNQLIRNIHTTLLGKSPEFETIRHIIGAELEGASPSISLENFLDQIKEAFLSAHEAFKKAANIRFQEILNELDPDLIAAQVENGLKFRPFRKAGYFEMYRERYQKLKKWFESGRFTEALLREFEKNCQKLYLEKRGKI
jgi:predicted component of type VI protein secretion system